VTRFWAEGLPLAVTVDDHATPVAFAWRGRRHAVDQVVERWRVDAGWWQRRAWREYFQLVTASGLLVLVYHDVRTGEWRLQRVYD
jgi:uncharacterized membrane protein (DUF2068 family)